MKQRFTELSDWLSWQQALHHTAIDLDLSRVSKVAQQLQLERFSAAVITVAGTNGKGSCCRLLREIYHLAGYRVGCYTSPHFIHYNERVWLLDRLATDAELCQAFAVIDQARQATPLTYFEFGTLAALWLFQQARLDVVILEVGMGGRLDAVNCVANDVAVITSIGLDHTAYLGETRAQIAVEKAGIIASYKPLVCGSSLPAVVRATASEREAPIYQLSEEFNYTRHADGSWFFSYQDRELNQLPAPKLAYNNAALALMVVEILRERYSVSYASICQALRQAMLAGRFQVGEIAGRRVILDVAHNEAAANFLYQQLMRESSAGNTIAVTAMLADKDVTAIIRELAPAVYSWHCASTTGPRGLAAATLTAVCQQQGLVAYCYESITAALAAAVAAATEFDRIVVFGSFVTVAEVLPQMQQTIETTTLLNESADY